MSSHATITCPESGFRKPIIWCSATDLPTPLRPRIQTVSPGKTSKLTWSSTRLSPKALKTRRPSLLALPRSFHLLRCVQVAKHLRLEPETSKLILFQRLHLRVGEKQINFV